MKEMERVVFEYRAIGIIRTPFIWLDDMPIQPSGAKGTEGTIEIFEPFLEGLQDLDGFSHIILLYHFHQSKEYRLKVRPFLDVQDRGVFATRAPVRPNPIGLSVVRLLSIQGRIIHIRDIDVLDGTPILDIKPFVPAFDVPDLPVRIGWLDQLAKRVSLVRSDSRFSDKQ